MMKKARNCWLVSLEKKLLGQLGEEADGQEEDHNGHIGSCGGYGLRQPGCLATSVRQEEVLLGQLCEEGEGQEEAGALASTPNPSSVQPSALRWRRGSGKQLMIHGRICGPWARAAKPANKPEAGQQA
jgi:hypothetical protein